MSGHRYTGYPTKSAYENARADQLRDQLFAMLGGCCTECGEVTNLEIDHPQGRDWSPRKLSRYRRNYRYLKEAREGKVRLLCAPCNKQLRPKPALVAEAGGMPF